MSREPLEKSVLDGLKMCKTLFGCKWGRMEVTETKEVKESGCDKKFEGSGADVTCLGHWKVSQHKACRGLKSVCVTGLALTLTLCRGSENVATTGRRAVRRKAQSLWSSQSRPFRIKHRPIS